MADDFENEVGYRKPPKANQFQKGHSGNPSGRPRKAFGIPELLRKIANQKVLTNTKSGPKRMTKLEASLTQFANKGAGGDVKSGQIFLQLLDQYSEAMKEKKVQETTDARNKLLAAFERYQG